MIGAALDAETAVALITAKRPDIVLLDVQLPGATGFDVLRQVPPPLPAVVCITAFDDYAIRAFEAHALDYVLKPYTDRRLAQAVTRAVDQVTSHEYRRWGQRLEALLREGPEAASTKPRRGRIAIRSLGRTDLVPIDEVVWIEARGYYARLHLRHGTLLHREPLDSLLARLDPATFVRVHRSAIVRLDAVTQVHRRRTGSHELTLSTGRRIAVSRTGWRELRRRLPDDSAEAPPASGTA